MNGLRQLLISALFVLIIGASSERLVAEAQGEGDDIQVRVIRLEHTGEIMVDVGNCYPSRRASLNNCYIPLTFSRVDFALAGVWFVAPFSDTAWVSGQGRTTFSGHVYISEATGAVHVAIAGRALSVGFPKPGWRLEGYSSEWTGSIRIERPAVEERPAAVATATPEPTPNPTPAPVVEEPGIILTLATSSTSQPLVIAYVEPNHPIGEMGVQLIMELDGQWVWTSTRTVIEAGERRALWGKTGRWEDVSKLQLRTLDGNGVRYWDCEWNRTRHDFEARMECVIGSVVGVEDLTDAGDATLWVYLADRDKRDYAVVRVEAYVRSDSITLNKPTVVTRNSERRGKTEYCRAENQELEIGVVEKMSCGGFAPEPPYDGPLPVPGLSHVHVNDVKAYVPGAGGYLYCQKHRDSDPQRSIWACEPW